MAKQTFTTGQVLTAAEMTALQLNDYNQTVSAKTASYTLVAADAGTRITMSNAGATTITVNTSLFAAGDSVIITNIGAGASTITAGTATVSTVSTLVLSQYDSGELYFTSTGVAIWQKYAGPAGGTPGLTLIKRSSFTTVTTTTTTFDNVFTSTYKAYKIVFETIYPNSGAVNLLFQYRVAGATQSAASYYTVSAGTNQAGTLQTLADTGGTSAKIAPIQSGGYITVGEILVTLVGGASQGPMYEGGFYAQTSQTAFSCGGSYNVAIVADGFILSASSSVITGTVAVYGLGA